MAKKPDSTAAAKPKQVVIRLGEAETDTLRPIGGSKSDRFNNDGNLYPKGVKVSDSSRLPINTAPRDGTLIQRF